VLKDDTELFKHFMDNESFKRWMKDTVFDLTYEPEAEGLIGGPVTKKLVSHGSRS
jgi:hypothetical protein